MLLYMLKGNSVTVLKAIATHGPEDRKRLRVIDIAIKAGVSEMTVRRHIKGLSACGYIKVQRPHLHSPYSFELLMKAHAELPELSQMA